MIHIYWKTIERLNMFGEPYTVGFSWFQTFPTSKRLRWPVGRAMESPLPWVCTRKELMRGELTELMARAKECSSIPPPWEIGSMTTLQEMWLIMLKSDEWKQRPYSMPNPRQGWLPNGMEIKGE